MCSERNLTAHSTSSRVIGENEQMGTSTSGKSYESERLANKHTVGFGGKASVEYLAK
jgi:hypothetical protein